RSACASMTRPRSRSASSNLAAATSATPASDDEAAAGVTERAAATAAADTKMEFMREIQESEDGMSRRALSRPCRLNPVSAVLSLSVAADSLIVGVHDGDKKKSPARGGRARETGRCGAVSRTAV